MYSHVSFVSGFLADGALWWNHYNQTLYSQLCGNDALTNMNIQSRVVDVLPGRDYWTSHWCFILFLYFSCSVMLWEMFLLLFSLQIKEMFYVMIAWRALMALKALLQNRSVWVHTDVWGLHMVFQRGGDWKQASRVRLNHSHLHPGDQTQRTDTGAREVQWLCECFLKRTRTYGSLPQTLSEMFLLKLSLCLRKAETGWEQQRRAERSWRIQQTTTSTLRSCEAMVRWSIFTLR